MWVDTHCHLDFIDRTPGHEAGADPGPLRVAADAHALGVRAIVIPAVEVGNFETCAQLGAAAPNAAYALGIHPICVPQARPEHLDRLRTRVEQAMDDPNFVAIGEIGLDYFIPALCTPEMRDKQEEYYRAQLKIARDFDLPVLLHVRRSQDKVLKHLRQIRPLRGIAHAFNGSIQQATNFIDLGFKLGFGGAMTFTRALQIRRLAVQVPLDAIVLETDAPDISPAWLHPARNSPEQLPAIGAALAEMRGVAVGEIETATTANSLAAIPRLSSLILS
ncbi:MAG TPA: TatD family hydrolase [Burkholderiaceae bacterium]